MLLNHVYTYIYLCIINEYKQWHSDQCLVLFTNYDSPLYRLLDKDVIMDSRRKNKEILSHDTISRLNNQNSKICGHCILLIITFTTISLLNVYDASFFTCL